MIGKTLLRLRIALAVIGLVLFAAAYPVSRRLTMDRQLASMFAADDPLLIQYQRLQHDFGGNAIVMLVYHDSELLSDAGLRRNRFWTEKVSDVPGVVGVLSPAELNRVVRSMRPPALFSAGESPGPALADPDDALATGFLDLFSGYTHSAGRDQAAVVAILDPERADQAVHLLRSVVKNAESTQGRPVLVGEPVLLNEGFDLLQRDGDRLATWTIALLSLVMVVTLRNLRFMLLSVTCIAWSVVVTRALAVLAGIELSMVSTILTAIVTVVVVAAVLHVGILWKLQIDKWPAAKGDDPTSTAASVINRLWIPVAWTCLTDAAGFASLAASGIRPVRDFGWLIAVAALMALVALAMFTPIALTLWPRDHRRKSVTSVHRPGAVVNVATRLVTWAIGHRRVVVATAVFLGIIALVGLRRTETETSFLKNFRDDSPLVQAYHKVERDLGGAGVWDITLPAPAIITDDYLESVRTLQTELRAIRVADQSLTKVISMADAERVAMAVPLLSLGTPEIRLAAMRAAFPAFSDALLVPPTQSQRRLRIMLRSREQLPADIKLRLIGRVQDVVRRHTATPQWHGMVGGVNSQPSPSKGSGRPDKSAAVTGYYVMLSALVRRLVADQWICFAVSFVLVWLLLAVMTASVRLSLTAVIANALPATLVLATLGWLGGRVNLGAAMIAAVSIGMSIDGSVHFLHHYRRCRRMGMNAPLASESAGSAVGAAMLLATVALVVGFGVMANSRFVPTATFGVLVAATLVLGTLVNLTVLPAAIVGWAKDQTDAVDAADDGSDDGP
ncbi:efflux RND transporter permease subunit [Crateriforma conspicua]|uniref:efflux RND transporter permease subunit n=1 Tax=Crateriforma conspicua TaxID=2527996 RepID=UPI001187CAAE|nr:MMPL family transporter [Crateriforma conspicua]QDV60984.1 MMPL family protein [Crateriforma conspicua]